MHIDIEKQLELETFINEFLENSIPQENYNEYYKLDAIIISKYISRYLNCMISVDNLNIRNSISCSFIYCFKDSTNKIDYKTLSELDSRLNDYLKYLLS